MLIKRVAQGLFEKLASTHKIVAVVGPRQAGKTTFLKEQMALGKEVVYVSLDDPTAKSLFDADVKKFEQQYMDKRKIIILDEVQYGKDAGPKLKYLADTGYKLWVSASSQILLEANVLSHLAGRVGILTLYPFSIDEFMNAKGQKSYTSDIFKRLVWEHAAYGGYPHVVLTEDLESKELLLKNLYTTVLLKDTMRGFGIEGQDGLERLAKYAAINIGREFHESAVSSQLGISAPTVRKYISALEKSYLLKRIYPFFTNKNHELVKMPKIYLADCGMRNAIMDHFPGELEEGLLFENYILTELLKRGYNVKYWKTKNKAEVDFVIERGKDVIPIEVKLFADGKIGRSLHSFIEKYSPTRAFVVSCRGETMQQTIGKTTIDFTTVEGLLPAHVFFNM